MTRFRRRLFSILRLLLVLLAVEVLGRLVFPQPILPFVASANPTLIFELNPKYPGVNSLGMRQAEIDVAALKGQFVIGVIGDSHTYSAGSADRNDAFPARLEYHLNPPARQAITVLNFGVPAYNMLQELEVLRAKALAYEPDLIILQYCINDDHIPNYIQPRYGWLNRAVHRSVALTGLWTTFLYSDFGRRHVLPYAEHAPDLLLFTPGLVGTPRSRETGTPHGWTHSTRSPELVPARYHDFIGRDHLERAVRSFAALCRSKGIALLATGFIEEGEEDLYRSSGFEVYSFFTMFRGLDMRVYGYDPDKTDGHFSFRGNEFIGQALAEFVRSHFSLSPRRHVDFVGSDGVR